MDMEAFMCILIKTRFWYIIAFHQKNRLQLNIVRIAYIFNLHVFF